MSLIDGLRARLDDLLDRRGREREVDEELAFHLDMEVAAAVGRGVPEAEARRAALARLGGVERVRAECREVRSGRFFEVLAQDLRYGARGLFKSPGFAIAAVLTLALGIGANTAVFSLVRGILLRPLPFAAGDRLVVLHQRAPGIGEDDELGFSAVELGDYRRASRTLDAIVEHHSMYFTLLGRDEPMRVRTGVVSGDFFAVFGVEPMLGRTLTAADDAPGADPVLVLGHDFWLYRLGGDPAIVGRTFEMNDRVHTVIGVLPPIPMYPEASDVYMPTSSCPFRSRDEVVHQRDFRMVRAFGRLAPGAGIEQAAAEVAGIAAGMAAEHPEAYADLPAFTAEPASLRAELGRRARPTLMLLLVTAALVLAIACANVANLMLARSLARERELAVRTALGAGRGRLLRQLLTESTLVGVAGGALGLLLAAAGLDLLVAFAGRFSERAAEVRIDGAVLAFTLAVSVAAGLAAGALPALRRRQPAAALGEGGARTTGGVSGLRSRETLIVLQLAVSLLLLVGAGLAGRSLAALYRVDPGFDPANVLVTRLHLNWTKYAEDEQIVGFAGPLLERAGRLPGVAAAALAGTFPLSEDGPVEVPVAIEGQAAGLTGKPGRAPRAEIQRVTTGYFRAAGVPLLAGREISDRDREDAPRVAVVSRRLARRRWGDADPIGARLTADGGETWWTVVGVAGDVKQHGLAEEFADIVYLPFGQAPTRGVSLLLRTRGGRPGELAPAVRDTVRQLDPGQPISEQRTLAEVRAEQLASPGLTALLVGLFASLALAISATGIAGVIAFAVSRRRREIGIRLALGAARGAVLRMVLGRGLALVGAGLALGLAAALAAGRFVTGMLYGVEPTDPATYLAVSVTLAAVATAACLLPARRATAIDPLAALREP